MSKISAHVHILTANRLRDGAVVFLNFDGDWVQTLAGAVIARSPDELRGLEARGVHDAARNLVVDPYLAEMREVAGALQPLRQRERLRLTGPSILGDVPGYVAPAGAAARSAADRGEALRPALEPAGRANGNEAEAA
jgi:Protein of unknown function (DUF2849)